MTRTTKFASRQDISVNGLMLTFNHELAHSVEHLGGDPSTLTIQSIEPYEFNGEPGYAWTFTYEDAVVAA